MHVIGITGWKNSGKTTLLSALVPLLKAAGASVSTVKHTHHPVELDTPGKDTWRHRAAGACEVMLVSSTRWALLHETGDESLVTLDDIKARLSPVDILLVEGFKSWPHDKIEIHRAAVGGEFIAATDPMIVAVVSDVHLEGFSVPAFALDDVTGVARFILARAGR